MRIGDLETLTTFHDKLNPDLWDNNHLKPQVRLALFKIAKAFVEFINVEDLELTDITISGSNASFNYNNKSDIDLHLIANSNGPCKVNLKDLFQAKKVIFNDQHDITILGHAVEVYVQGSEDAHISNGVYSVYDDNWVAFPKKITAKPDITNIEHKFEHLEEEIKQALESGDPQTIARLKKRIKDMRQSGLEKNGEFGAENLAFKLLRNTGLIQKLYDAETIETDKELSLGQQGVAEGSEQSLSSMVSQDQAERNEYQQFVKSQAGGDWTKGAKMYAQLKKRPANDIFDDASRLNQFMKMTFDFDKFTDEDWDNYWLLAQHCDDNRAFQKQALATIKKYQGVDHSHYKYLYDRISVGLTGKQKYGTQNIQEGVAEGFSNDMSTEDMIAYLRQHHDTNLHQDYLDHINTFSKFVLKDIPVNSIKTDLPKLDRAKVEQYKQMDFSKAPPIVIGGGYILDGYHRANVAKALGIPTIKAYVGVQGQQGVAEGLSESRNSLFAFVKQQFPTWPDYVLKDFLYQQAKGIRDQAELDDFLKRNKQDFGNCKWTLTKLPITVDIFTPKTQRMLASREGGSSNPFQVPRDAERHAQQSQMIQQKGVSAEPIIVAKLSNGYDLIEGWHRTIQHLKAFPQGYTGPAWVCTGATYKSESVEQGVAEGNAFLGALNTARKNNLEYFIVDGKKYKVKKNKKIVKEEELSEKWSKKYKRSIDCSHPKGFSQKAHCAGRRKKK